MISSGHQTFDRQANHPSDCITTGNVWGNVQLSGFIRASSETKCNGFDFEHGSLRNRDLSMFKNLPKCVEREVHQFTRNKTGILYEFRHWVAGKKHVHGYILTDAKYQFVKAFAKGITKSQNVIKAVLPIVAKGEENAIQLTFIS